MSIWPSAELDPASPGDRSQTVPSPIGIALPSTLGWFPTTLKSRFPIDDARAWIP